MTSIKDLYETLLSLYALKSSPNELNHLDTISQHNDSVEASLIERHVSHKNLPFLPHFTCRSQSLLGSYSNFLSFSDSETM
jgi:hypothetical protein